MTMMTPQQCHAQHCTMSEAQQVHLRSSPMQRPYDVSVGETVASAGPFLFQDSVSGSDRHCWSNASLGPADSASLQCVYSLYYTYNN